MSRHALRRSEAGLLRGVVQLRGKPESEAIWMILAVANAVSPNAGPNDAVTDPARTLVSGVR